MGPHVLSALREAAAALEAVFPVLAHEYGCPATPILLPRSGELRPSGLACECTLADAKKHLEALRRMVQPKRRNHNHGGRK